jgi:hypothetical protein
MPKLGRTTPCSECPWRVNSARGYLGTDNAAHFYWASITAESEMPCHEQVDYDDPDWQESQLPGADLCAGMLIHYVNTMKGPRRPSIAAAVKAVKASKAVFTWPWEFMAHHMPGASADAVKAAWQQAVVYAGSPEDEAKILARKED